MNVPETESASLYCHNGDHGLPRLANALMSSRAPYAQSALGRRVELAKSGRVQ